MINRAEKDLGLGEPNYIQRWYADRNGSAYSYNFAWCDAAVTKWGYDSGNYAAVCPRGDRAYTVYHAQGFQNLGRWHHDIGGIRAGDIVFFDWGGSNSIGRIDHVGVVTKVRGGTVYTIEANTGNACKRRVRYSGSIAGYGRPDYEGKGSNLTLPFKKGAVGEEVERIQKMLMSADYKLPQWGADAEFGDETRSAVTVLNRDYGTGSGGTYTAESHAILMLLANKKYLDIPYKEGDEGNDVEGIQENLMASGYPLPQWGSDAQWGDETTGAMSDFNDDWGVSGNRYTQASHEAMRTSVLKNRGPSRAEFSWVADDTPQTLQPAEWQELRIEDQPLVFLEGPAKFSASISFRLQNLDSEAEVQARAVWFDEETGERKQSHPIDSKNHAGGNLHFTRGLRERLNKGVEAHIEVIHYGNGPAVLDSKKVTTIFWKED